MSALINQWITAFKDIGQRRALEQSFQEVTDTLAVEAANGILSGVGVIYRSSVSKLGGIIKTSILIDLTGLSSATSDLDIIGVGTDPAYLGRITSDQSGTILSGRVTCLETPSSLTDIDLYSATVGTGAFEDGIAALVETALVTHGGAWSAGQTAAFTGLPTDGGYLYLTNGAADTADPFTAGKFLIELEGYEA
jgi:hypothetical protein